MNVPHDVLNRVVNYLMNVFIKVAVGAEIIGQQLRTRCNILSDRFVDDMLASASNYFAFNLSAPFKQSHNSSLADESGIGSDLFGLLVLVHESGRATYERFVGFNSFAWATQLFKRSRLHCESDSVHQEPSGFLSDPKSAVDFIGADTVLGSTYHPDGRKPLVEADRGIFHQGSELDRKHLLALFVLALPRSASRNECVLVRATARASDPIRPAKRDHKAQRVVRIVEVYDCLLKRFWEAGLLFLCHSGPRVP